MLRILRGFCQPHDMLRMLRGFSKPHDISESEPCIVQEVIETGGIPGTAG